MPLGPGDHRRTPPTRMIADLLARRTPAYADLLLNVVDARDCAEGLARMAEAGRPGTRYVLSGHNVHMSALLAELALVSGVRMPHRRMPTWVARAFATVDTLVADRITKKPPTAPRAGVAIAARQRPFDNTRARRELGFAPRPLSVTLADTVGWLQAEARADG
jgi:dihydroflavonol-4-reductase